MKRDQNNILTQEASVILNNNDATLPQIDVIYEMLKGNNEEMNNNIREIESYTSDEAFKAEYATILACEDNVTGILAKLQTK